MDKGYSQTDAKMIDYAYKLCEPGKRPEDHRLVGIREKARHRGFPPIHVGEFDGLHLELMVRISNAVKVVEIGTLVGYSGVCLMRGMKKNGHLYTFELHDEQAKMAIENFIDNGFNESHFTVFVGAALERLPEIEKNGPFDAVFIDADKANYIYYLAWAEKNLRQGGVLIADNTFAWNMLCEEVIEDAGEKYSVDGVRAFNEALKKNLGFRFTMLPTSEGLTVAVKL